MMSACSYNRVKFAYLQGRQSSLFKSIRRALSNKENSGRIDLPIVEVKKAKLRLFREGNSIVFDGAVQNTKGSPKQVRRYDSIHRLESQRVLRLSQI
jgi:hypothetical protein